MHVQLIKICISFCGLLRLGNPNFHEIGNLMTSLIQFWCQTADILIALLHYPSGVVHQVSGPEILWTGI